MHRTALPAFCFLAVSVAALVLPSAALVVFSALAGLVLLEHLQAAHDRALKPASTSSSSATAPEEAPATQEASRPGAGPTAVAAVPALLSNSALEEATTKHHGIIQTSSAGTSSSSTAADAPVTPVSAVEPSTDYPGLSAEERSAVQRLIDTLSADASFAPDHVSMHINVVNAARFLRARNWNFAKAEALWRDAVHWRRSFGMSERRRRLKASLGRDPKADFCSAHWMMWHMTDDNHGIPVVLFRAGTSDPAGLTRETGSVEDFIERHVTVLEEAMEAAYARGLAHLGLVDVTDLREFPEVGSWFSRCYNSVSGFMQLAKILDNCYPERARAVVLIGAPSVFQVVWRMFQSVIPAETKKKIKMFGPKEDQAWLAELHRHVRVVPRYLGGTGPNNRVLLGDIVPRGSLQAFASAWSESLVLGLVADVQYADMDDGPNFAKTRVRKYRGALEVGLRAAVDDFVECEVHNVVQLGDAIDGFAKRNDGSRQAMRRVLAMLDEVPCAKHHLVGNHELYNFHRRDLGEAMGGAAVSWRSAQPRPGWRLVFLDSYAHSVLGVDAHHEGFVRASEVLQQGNPNDWKTAGNWLHGLYSLQRRFVPYNGQLGDDQLGWLRGELDEALRLRQRVVVFSHVPLCPGSASSSCLVWDFPAALRVLAAHAASRNAGECGVVAVFAGHDHRGGYAVDAAGIHHVTLASPLEAATNVAHAVGAFSSTGLTLMGRGAVEPRRLKWCASTEDAQKWRDEFLADECRSLVALCKGTRTAEECRAIIDTHEGAWDYLGPDWPKRYDD